MQGKMCLLKVMYFVFVKIEWLFWSMVVNPLSPSTHIQILQTDPYTFPSWMGWENLIKDQGIFS